MFVCINHEQVRMDYIFFVPPFAFCEGIRIDFANPNLDDGTDAWCSCAVSG
jgi:hypothetical protein